MAISISTGGVGGITVENDPTALKLTGGTLSGTLFVPTVGNLLNTNLSVVAYNDVGAGTTYSHTFTPLDGKFNLATNGGGLTFPNGTTQTTAGLPLTGGTLTGKLNALTTATTAGVNLGHWTANPTAPVAGDIWIVDRLNFTNRLGNTIGVVTTNQASTIATSASTPILGVDQSGSGGAMVIKNLSTTSVGTTLRIENRGTGNSFVVEDTTTPDGTAFAIDQFGKVGIGTAPSTACLSVDGNGINFNGSTVTDLDVYNATTPPSGWDANTVSNCIRIRINGANYFIPYWSDPNNP
jgi:hypothetical protein